MKEVIEEDLEEYRDVRTGKYFILKGRYRKTYKASRKDSAVREKLNNQEGRYERCCYIPETHDDPGSY